VKGQAGADCYPAILRFAKPRLVAWIETVLQDGEPRLNTPILVVDGIDAEESKHEIPEVLADAGIERVELRDLLNLPEDRAGARIRGVDVLLDSAAAGLACGVARKLREAHRHFASLRGNLREVGPPERRSELLFVIPTLPSSNEQGREELVRGETSNPLGLRNLFRGNDASWIDVR